MKGLSIYAELMATEAQRRGINVRSFPDISQNLLVLTHGDHQEYLYQSISDRIGHAKFKAIFDKGITNILLSEAGFPVPDSIISASMEEAIAFLDQHQRIVVKPLGQSAGNSVTVNITDHEVLKKAMQRAQKVTRHYEKKIICQEQVEGQDHRVLVVNQKDIFAAQRIPAHVKGDGQHSVLELVTAWNTQVYQNRQIKLKKRATRLLQQQQLTLESIPQANQVVFLSDLCNAHQGAIVQDETDIIADEVRQMALDIAKHFDCPLVGIDFISPDITKTPGKIIELNPHAGIAMHHQPTYGQSRNVAGAILDMLFPEIKSI